MGEVAKIKPVSGNPLASLAERIGVDSTELDAVLKQTVFPNPNPTNEQFIAFLAVANAYGLNPLKKEIYAFPGKGNSIQPIVSIDGWLSIINSRPEFDGMELVENYSDGVFVSVTCKMYRSDRTHPTVVTEDLEECKKNTEPWKKPKRMLRHKATIQCARYAFGLGGIMEEDEGNYAAEREIANAAPVDRSEPTAYPADQFAVNLPKWKILVEGGRKSPREIIDTVEAKGFLSQEQKDAIYDCAPIDVNTETGEVIS
jgi:phage recombination protein Bet